MVYTSVINGWTLLVMTLTLKTQFGEKETLISISGHLIQRGQTDILPYFLSFVSSLFVYKNDNDIPPSGPGQNWNFEIWHTTTRQTMMNCFNLAHNEKNNDASLNKVWCQIFTLSQQCNCRACIFYFAFFVKCLVLFRTILTNAIQRIGRKCSYTR